MNASPPGGRSNGTVVSEISLVGGVGVAVGDGGVVAVGTGLVAGGGAVPVGVGPDVPVGAGFAVPVGAGLGVPVGAGPVVPLGAAVFPAGAGPPGAAPHVVAHESMSCEMQKQASTQVAHVPHAGALEHPGAIPGVDALEFDFPESEVEPHAIAAKTQATVAPTMLGFM